MIKNNIIAGLDIGSSKIALVIGEKDDNDQIKILYCNKQEIDLARTEYISEIIISMINEAEMKTNIKINEAFISYKDSNAKSVLSKVSYIRTKLDECTTEEDVEILKQKVYTKYNYQKETLLQLVTQEYIIDGEDGIQFVYGKSGICFEAIFLLILGELTEVQKYKKLLLKANIEIKGIQLNSLASAEAVLTEENMAKGVVLVDIGSKYSEIAVYSGCLLRHFAVIPFGGELITEDIQKGFAITKKQAEKIKIKYGSAIFKETNDEFVQVSEITDANLSEISLNHLTQIVSNRINELIVHIEAELKKTDYKLPSSVNGTKLIPKIILCGGGARLQNIADLIEMKTTAVVEIGNPALFLTSNSIELEDCTYSAAIGMIHRGVNKGKEFMIKRDE